MHKIVKVIKLFKKIAIMTIMIIIIYFYNYWEVTYGRDIFLSKGKIDVGWLLVSSGMIAQKNRKIGNSGLIASLHPIKVVIKATSPQLLCSQDLHLLSRLRGSENGQ